MELFQNYFRGLLQFIFSNVFNVKDKVTSTKRVCVSYSPPTERQTRFMSAEPLLPVFLMLIAWSPFFSFEIITCSFQYASPVFEIDFRIHFVDLVLITLQSSQFTNVSSSFFTVTIFAIDHSFVFRSRLETYLFHTSQHIPQSPHLDFTDSLAVFRFLALTVVGFSFFFH